MKKYYLILTSLITLLIFIISCSKSEETYVPVQETPVSADLANVPYAKLSDYHFFKGDNLKDEIPNTNVIPYEPASMLFTDYAHKKRFIWMPSNVKATYNTDNKILNFPLGTVLIKSFYYNTIQPNNTTRIIETRVMIKKNDGWKFYEYIWNDEQTEATLLTGTDFESGSSTNITFKKENGEIINTNYRIPSATECLACHKINDVPTPIGVKPQNLNHNYTYTEGSKNILLKLKEQNYLESYPANIVSTVDYTDTSQPLDLRFRSYIDINCGHCHQDQGRCDYRALRLGFSETTNPQNLGICVNAAEPFDNVVMLIKAGNYDKSVMHFRLSNNEENKRMPLLGRTIVHDEGVALVEEYISSLTQTCN